MIKTLSLAFATAILIAGCTMTSARTKNPIFSKPVDSLQIDINKLVSYEAINLDGKEITTNGKISSDLEIDIINGHNIPTDENQMNELGKKIAMTIKGALQDKNEYDTYKVLFVTKKVSGNMTQRNWKGKIFKSQEL